MESGKNDILAKLPRKLVDRLMPFQKEGVKFAVKKNGRCLIADEMGLGKTLQAISVAYYYRQEWPLLIIVPSSLRYSWIEEFEKWLPDINPEEINLVQSGNDISDIDKSQITVTTFGLLSKSTSRILREALMSQGFKVVIVDESHYIRNNKTVSAKTVVPLIKKANRRILLSGTPALARPVELYPQIDAICPNEFGSWWTYTSQFCDAKTEFIGKIRRRNVNGASNLVELQQKLSNLLMIRREKSQVLTQLPPKQRQRVLFELKDSDLKKEIRQTFDELRPLLKRSTQEKFEVLTGAGDHDAKDTNTLSLIQRLYRLSGEAKIGPAKEYVEMLCENPNLKFLVFAYHHNMMNGLSESLHDKKVKFIRIDGETPPSERPHLVHKFQSDPDIRVAVLSILAAGVGLTLTAATVVVFAEMYWTPGTMIQCEDRAHRIGQTSSVAIHYLVARDTMDEWVWSAVCKKTIVTSTTLTGKKRKLEALDGDKYQVDVLSNAEAWVPTSAPENSSLAEYFETSLDTGQKSILSFFSPSTKSAKNRDSVGNTSTSSHRTRFDDKLKSDNNSYSPTMSVFAKSENCSTPPSKRIKLDPLSQNEDSDIPLAQSKKMKASKVIVIDSDGEDFVDERMVKSSSKKHVRSSQKKPSGSDSLKKSPTNSLKALFDNSKKSEYHKQSSSQQGKKLQTTPNHSKSRDSSKCAGNVKEKSHSWNCETCTYLNHSELVYCEICETPKKNDDSSKSRPKSSKVLSKISDNGGADCVASKSKLNRKDQKVSNIVEDNVLLKDDKIINEDNVNMDSDEEVSSVKSLLDEEDPLADLDSLEGEIKNKVCLEGLDGGSDNGNNFLQISTGTEECNHLENIDENKETDKDDGNKTNCREKHTGMVSKYFCDSMETDLPDVALNASDNSKSEQSQSSNVTPVSARKYRFKSLKKDGNNESCRNSEEKLKLECEETKQINLNFDKVIHELPACTEEVSGEKSGSNAEHTIGVPADHGQSNDSSSEMDDVVASESDSVARETSDDVKVVDLDSLPVFPMFKYQCSKYTDRIYMLTKEEEPLNMNFIPSDVQFGNDDGLPDILYHPDNLRLVQRFVREWTSLTETKKRLLIKAGQPFISPLLEYEKVRSCKSLNTQRHKSKNDTMNRAYQKAAEINGTVRTISKQTGSTSADSSGGITQAVADDGTPLCLQCFQPYTSQLVTKSSIVDEENAWNTRFCSRKCSQEYWMVSNNDYIRDRVFEAEHGVCQLCQYDAHSLFRRVRDCQDQMKRAEMISGSKFRSLTVKVKQQMVRKPSAGQFWHADHIKPVWEGGGQCDIDNLRTLCVICHQKVTAGQATKRATVKKLGAAVNAGDISAFFQRN